MELTVAYFRPQFFLDGFDRNIGTIHLFEYPQDGVKCTVLFLIKYQFQDLCRLCLARTQEPFFPRICTVPHDFAFFFQAFDFQQVLLFYSLFFCKLRLFLQRQPVGVFFRVFRRLRCGQIVGYADILEFGEGHQILEIFRRDQTLQQNEFGFVDAVFGFHIHVHF